MCLVREIGFILSNMSLESFLHFNFFLYEFRLNHLWKSVYGVDVCLFVQVFAPMRDETRLCQEAYVSDLFFKTRLWKGTKLVWATHKLFLKMTWIWETMESIIGISLFKPEKADHTLQVHISLFLQLII